MFFLFFIVDCRLLRTWHLAVQFISLEQQACLNIKFMSLLQSLSVCFLSLSLSLSPDITVVDWAFKKSQFFPSSVSLCVCLFVCLCVCVFFSVFVSFSLFYRAILSCHLWITEKKSYACVSVWVVTKAKTLWQWSGKGIRAGDQVRSFLRNALKISLMHCEIRPTQIRTPNPSFRTKLSKNVVFLKQSIDGLRQAYCVAL